MSGLAQKEEEEVIREIEEGGEGVREGRTEGTVIFAQAVKNEWEGRRVKGGRGMLPDHGPKE